MIKTKDYQESVVLDFDFSSELTSVEVGSVIISTYAGQDPSPGVVLENAHQVLGASILQRIHGGVRGAHYAIRALASNGSNKIIREVRIKVV